MEMTASYTQQRFTSRQMELRLLGWITQQYQYSVTDIDLPILKLLTLMKYVEEWLYLAQINVRRIIFFFIDKFT